ncbi:MAG TPA: RNA polymerase sigma factor [Rhizomicrobium sp.]|nr:RNA polymerase sigma factor [Rhizomicrobium sp.]
MVSGVTDRADQDRETSFMESASSGAPAVDAWFLREVLPLEMELVGYFRRNWRNQSDVRDLVQDVYVRVYAHLFDVREQDFPQQPRSFVFTVARNTLINKFRDLRVVPIETVGDLEGLTVKSDQPGPERSVMARDELRRLQHALDELSPRCREAFVLRQIEGCSRREIAQRMGLSEATVREYLAIGLFKLSDIFFGEAADNGRSA